MSKEDNGGPAFPQTQALDLEGPNGLVSGSDVGEGGMTLRDYFAARSIAGINPGKLYGDDAIQSIAEQSYKLADAMLKARQS